MIERIGGALGTEPTPEAIQQRYQVEPAATLDTVARIEADDFALWL